MLIIENTDLDLKANARAALCKLATPTRQTCLSRTRQTSRNYQKQVLVMINATPGLKVNQRIIFCLQVFVAAFESWVPGVV